MTQRARQGYSVSLVLAGIAAAAALVVASVNSTTLTKGGAPAPAPPRTETSSRPARASTLLRLTGLSPEVCAAAGLSVAQATSLAGHAVRHLGDHGPDLQAAVETESRTKRDLSQLEIRVRRGEAVQDQLEASRQAHASAESNRDVAVAALLSAALGDLPHDVVQNFAMIREQRQYGLPLAYCLERRTEADAVAIRDALADQRIAQRDGSRLSDGAQQVLNAHRPSEIAIANLANLDAYRRVWREALDPR